MLTTALDWEKASDRQALPSSAPPGWIRQWCCPSKSVAVVQDPVRAGQHAVRFQLDRDDPLVSDSKRCEFSAPNPDAGVERFEAWYGFSIHLPGDYQQDPSPESHIQWHQHSDVGGSPPLALLTRDGHWLIAQAWEDHESFRDLGPYRTGRWTDWVLHVKWTPDGVDRDDGFIDIWQDGEAVGPLPLGKNKHADGHPVYLKFGIYKWDWRANPDRSHINERVTFFDELRIADAAGSFEEVSPGSTRPSPGARELVPTAELDPERWQLHGAPDAATALAGSIRQPDPVPPDSYIWASDRGRITQVGFADAGAALPGGAAWFYANTGPATVLLAQLIVDGRSVADVTVGPEEGFSWRSIAAPPISAEQAKHLALRFVTLAGTDSNVRAAYFSANATGDLRVPDGGIPPEVYTDATGWANPWARANAPWLDPSWATLPEVGGQWRSGTPWGEAITVTAEPGSFEIQSLTLAAQVPGEPTRRQWTWQHQDIDMRLYCRRPWYATDESNDAARHDGPDSAQAVVPGSAETFGVLHFYPRSRPGDLPRGMTAVTVDAEVRLSSGVIARVGCDWWRYPVGGNDSTDHAELGGGYWYQSANTWQRLHLSYCGEPDPPDGPYIHCGEEPPWLRAQARRRTR